MASTDDALIRRAEQWLDGVTDEWCDCPECAQTIIRDLLAAVRAREEWLPIATAPKATRVLAFWQRSRAMALVSQDARGNWWDDDDAHYSEPTHWRALPSPPDGAQEDC